jgi:hypothetical protein
VRACELIIQWAAGKPGEFFDGDPDAFVALAALPMEQRATGAMQLFGRRQISRLDLETVLSTVRADQTARIAELERDVKRLENENKDLHAQLMGHEIEMPVST